MTEQELKVLELTKEAWNAFLQLPVVHGDDQNEFRLHIHALQNMVLAREGQRVMNSTRRDEVSYRLKRLSLELAKDGIVRDKRNRIK